YDAVWVTTCPVEIQLARLTDLRHLSLEDAQHRLRAQLPQSEKLARADMVIDTSGSLKQTYKQVKQAWQLLPVVTCRKKGPVQTADA
ncbi:MAG: dephospho-CoA kinase, partial [Anaerolineae bacterium]|nr:dephospho-CoA kinase [Anaerolineae bacterium]